MESHALLPLHPPGIAHAQYLRSLRDAACGGVGAFFSFLVAIFLGGAFLPSCSENKSSALGAGTPTRRPKTTKTENFNRARAQGLRSVLFPAGGIARKRVENSPENAQNPPAKAKRAGSTLRTSRAVPHLSTIRALQWLTSEF